MAASSIPSHRKLTERLQPAIEPVKRTVERFEQQVRFGPISNPFKRALKAISGEEV